MQIWVRSKHWIENHFEPVIRCGVISITTPGDRDANIPKSKLIWDILRLKFNDITKEIPNEVLFTREMARAIWLFSLICVEYFHAELIVVHCDAGISRSAAVAAALSKVFNGTDEYYFDNYVPNTHVYKTMLGGLLENEEM